MVYSLAVSMKEGSLPSFKAVSKYEKSEYWSINGRYSIDIANNNILVSVTK